MGLKKRSENRTVEHKSTLACILKKHEDDILNKRLEGLYNELIKSDFSITSHVELLALMNKVSELQSKEYDIVRRHLNKAALEHHHLITSFIPELVVRESVLKNVKPHYAEFLRAFIHESEKAALSIILNTSAAKHMEPELHCEASRKLHTIKMSGNRAYSRIQNGVAERKKILVDDFIRIFGRQCMPEMLKSIESSVELHKSLDRIAEQYPSATLAGDIRVHIEENLNLFEHQVIDAFKYL